MRHIPAGGQFFTLDTTQAPNVLKKYTNSLMYPHADALPWKAVRTGKTTALASHGVSLPQVMGAGEWASARSSRHSSG